MKYTIDDYERYIRDLIENSVHSRVDLIEDLKARGLDNTIATAIVDKYLKNYNDKVSIIKPQKYLLGLFLILGSLPVAILILWRCHEAGVSLTNRTAFIPIGMIITGIIAIKRANRIKQIK